MKVEVKVWCKLIPVFMAPPRKQFRTRGGGSSSEDDEVAVEKVRQPVAFKKKKKAQKSGKNAASLSFGDEEEGEDELMPVNLRRKVKVCALFYPVYCLMYPLLFVVCVFWSRRKRRAVRLKKCPRRRRRCS